MLLLAITACGKTSEKNVLEDDVQGDVTDMESEEEAEKEGTAGLEENEDEDSDIDQSVSKTNEVEKTKDKNTTSTSTEVKSKDKASSENKGSEEKNEHQEVIDLAYDIFDAQDKKDYQFLESIAAKGTKVDKENNQFIFEDVTYPFEMEFFTKEDLGKLEYRYVHEKSANNVIVGFGAIHSGDKSSFVIDFEFAKEDGKWKMKSMDINK